MAIYFVDGYKEGKAGFHDISRHGLLKYMITVPVVGVGLPELEAPIN